MRLFAVIPTVGERDATLIPMVNRLLLEGVGVIIVPNAKTAPVVSGDQFVNGGWTYAAHSWGDDPVNLSKIWNMGLDVAHEAAEGEDYVVAVLNDDLIIPPDMVHDLAEAVVRTDSVCSYAAYWSSPTKYQKFNFRSPWHLGNRMCGYAFALRGSAGLRADEDFLWWWGDSDLDLRARRAGGVVGVQVPGLEHLDPNGYTNRNPALTEQAGRDRATFQRKHGFLPW